MSQYSHIMVDLETLGHHPGCIILSIGAVIFNEEEIKADFYKKFKIQEQIDKGMRMDESTLAWWLTQSDKARAEVAMPGVAVSHALEKFNSFIDLYSLGKDLRVWGNGATFDNVLLEALYRAFDVDIPWSFSDHRCYRTIKTQHLDIEGDNLGAENASHVAVEDATWQAKHLIRIHKHRKSIIK